jgi:hypothetical protein
MIGFPIGGPFRSPKKHDDSMPIEGFEVSGDGVGCRVELDPEEMQSWAKHTALHPCEKIAFPPAWALRRKSLPRRYRMGPNLVTRRGKTTVAWYFWNQTLRPGRTELRVTYALRAPDWCAVHYILRTTRHWGDGTIGKLQIEVRQSGLRRFKKLRARLGTPPALRAVRRRVKAFRPKPTRVDKASQTMVWELQDVQPYGDLTLRVPGCAVY